MMMDVVQSNLLKIKNLGMWSPSKLATEHDIEQKNQEIQMQGGTLPKDYSAFLLLQDGLHWEGIVFFGTQDEINVVSGLWLILGKTTDGVSFSYHLKEKYYAEIDSSSFDVFEKCDSFSELLKYVIEEKEEDILERHLMSQE